MYNKEVVYTLALVVSLLILYNSQKKRQSLSTLLASATTPPRLVIGNKLRFGLKLDQGSQIITISNTGTQIKTSNQTTLSVTSDGKIGVGTTTPSSMFHVHGEEIEVNSMHLDNTTISGLSSLIFGSNTSTDMVVSGNAYFTGSSRFGIGTTLPQYTIDATDGATFSLGKGIKTVPRDVGRVTCQPFLSTGTVSSPANSGIITFTSGTRFGTIVIDPSISTSKKVQLTIQASSTSVSSEPPSSIPTVMARYVKVRFESLNGLQKNIALAEIKVYDNTLSNLVTKDTVTSTSSILGNFISKLVTDNDPSTFWHPLTDANPWIQVDLGSDRAIHMIAITARDDPILYSRQLGMVVDCISSAGTVVYTSTPAHSPTGNTNYGEGGSDGYPYYYYVPALGTTTNGSYVRPIVEPMVLCPAPIPPHPSVKLSYENTYFVIHDGKSVLYTSPYLTGTLTTYKTPTLTRAPNTTKLFMAIVGEKNVSVNFSNVKVNDYTLVLDGQLMLDSLPFTTGSRKTMTVDGDSLSNQYGPHTFALVSSQPAPGMSDKQIHCLLDTDPVNQSSSIQSTVEGGYSLCINPRGGNVSIGKANPITALEVNDKVKSGYRYTQSASYNLTQVNDNDKWLKIASFTGPTYGEFLLSWTTPGDHGNVRFDASCAFNNHNVINILGTTLYNAEFDWIRISTDNTSIYNTNYIEVHVRQGSWYWDTVTLNVHLLNVGPITGGLAVIQKKTYGTTTGYSYYSTPTTASFTTQLNTMNMFFNGNLGIGTVTPSASVDVVDNTKYLTTRLQSNATYTGFNLINSAEEGWQIGSSASGNVPVGSMYFSRMGGNSVSVITPSGFLGIGTTNPSSKLEVFTNTGRGWDSITSRVISTGDAAAGMRLINNVGGCYWFLNASNRVNDGGANAATLRNDTGGLRLQNAAGQCTLLLNGRDATLWSGSFTANASTALNGSTWITGSTFVVNAATTVSGTTTISSNVTVNANASYNGLLTVSDKFTVNSSTGETRINGPTTITGSNFVANATVGLNGHTTVTGSNFIANATTTLNGHTTVTGSNFIANATTTFNGVTSVNASDFVVNAATIFNGPTWCNGKLVIQNGVNGGPNRGIWIWHADDSNWGIYMATSYFYESGTAMNGGSAPTGSGFSSHAIRFRVANWEGYGFVFENSSNELLASIRASDGYTYFKSLWTTKLDYNRLYANNWFRLTTWNGVYWQNYGQGMQATGNASSTFGTISTYGSGRNGYHGWSIHDWGSYMGDGEVMGIHRNGKAWVIRGDSSNIHLGTNVYPVIFPVYTRVSGFTINSGASLGQTVIDGSLAVNGIGGYPEKLSVNGNIYTTGAFNLRSWVITPSWDETELQFYSDWGHMNSMFNWGGWWRGSDIKIKTDIKPLSATSSIKKIMGIQPVSYLHTNIPNPQRRTIGFIAQQVQEVNPYCVSEQECSTQEDELDEDGKQIPATDENGTIMKDKDGFVIYKKKKVIKDKKLGICYEDLYIHAINTVKAQHQEIETKKERIKRLTELISYQNSLLHKLNMGIDKLERQYFSY